MDVTDVRKGCRSERLVSAAFEQRFKSQFVDPVFAHCTVKLQAITDAGVECLCRQPQGPITRRPVWIYRSRVRTVG